MARRFSTSEREIVISLRRGIPLAELVETPGDSLESVVKSIAPVRVTDVLPTGRCLVVRATDAALERLEGALSDACHFVERTQGHAL